MTIHFMDAVADEDSLVLVAEHIAGVLNDGVAKTALVETPGSKFSQECMELLQAQRVDQYVAKMVGHTDLIFTKNTASEAECISNVLVHAITRVPAEQQAPLVQGYSSALTSKVDERAEERLGALLNLYGALTGTPTLQRHVLLIAADYARRGPNLARILAPAVRGKSSDWINLWKLDDAQTRELLIALANLVKAGVDRASVKEYQRLVGCALELCKEGDAAAIAQLQPLAVAACIEFIKSNVLFQADWCSSPAIKALANDPATKAVYGLFAAVLSGNLTNFKAAAVPAALEAAGVTLDTALSKARLVALLALCSSTHSQEVSFSALRTALDVGPEAVESWVVKAIGIKLLEAKIDQVREVVVVSRCTQRMFGPSEWSTLETQLASWRDALKGAQQMLIAHKSSAAATATGASSAARPPAAVKA